MKPYYDDGQITIYHGNCRDILPTLNPVDLVLTDPPYGIGDKWTHSVMIGKNGASRLWGQGETWDDEPADIVSLINLDCHICILGGNYFTLPPARQWLIWDKGQIFSGSDAELAWTNWPGTVRIYRMTRIDAFVNKATQRKTHPTEKPLGLMRWCISLAPNQPQTILDPFMGSGTTLRAAKDLGRKAIGIEIEERYCEIAVKRLAQEVLAF